MNSPSPRSGRWATQLCACLYTVPGTAYDMDVNVSNGTIEELKESGHLIALIRSPTLSEGKLREVNRGHNSTPGCLRNTFNKAATPNKAGVAVLPAFQ